MSDAIPLVLVVAAITSVIAVIAARRRLGSVSAGAGMVVEVIGATVLFFVANLAVGAALSSRPVVSRRTPRRSTESRTLRC